MSNTHSLDLELSSSHYAGVGDASQTGLEFTGDFTVEFWTKIESQPATDDSNRFTFLCKFDSSPIDGYLFRYRYNTTSEEYEFIINLANNGSQDVLTYEYELSTSAWTHLAFVYDSSESEVEIFINGSSATTLIGGNVTTLGATSATFFIGTQDTVDNWYDGLIDDVRAWSDKRTSTEIADNYDIELQGNESNLEGYWKLNNDYTDETTNSNDLTAANSPTFSSDTPIFSSPSPSISPSISPSVSPSVSLSPSLSSSLSPSLSPSISPSTSPSLSPSISTSISPSVSPSISPSLSPSVIYGDEPLIIV